MQRSADEILDQEFLQVRAKILEVAAFFDRLTTAESNPESQPQAECLQTRLELLRNGTEILRDEEGDKAARVQLLFSREYDEDWREKYGL